MSSGCQLVSSQTNICLSGIHISCFIWIWIGYMWRVWNWPHTIRYNQILIPFIFHLVLLETSHCFWQVLGSTECILRSRCLCRLTMGLVLKWQLGWFHFLKCSCSQQSCFSSPVALPPVQSQSHLNLCPFHPDLHRQLCHHHLLHLLHWLHLLLAPLSLDPPYLSVWMGTCDPGSLPTYKIKKFRLSYSLTLWIFKVTHKSPKNYKKMPVWLLSHLTLVGSPT